MQERASSGKDLQFHLGQGDSSHMHSFLRQNQSKFWPSSYPTYALLWAYLTTLLWHRHIVDLCICQIILHANQMLQRREREFSFAAWPSLEEEHLFPNKSKIKKMIHRSSIVCLEMWESDSLCAHRYSLPREVFIYISSGCKFFLILSEFKNFYIWNTGWESHVLPAAFIPVRLRAFWPQGPRVEVEAQSALTGGTMNRVRSCQLSAQLPLLECK